MADPVFDYPSGDDRKDGAVLSFPFRCTATPRLHRTEAWRTEPRLALARVEVDGYRGQIEVGEGRGGDDSCVEVRQTFTLARPRFTADEHRRFHEEWIRFLIAVHQPYTYDRALSESEVAQLEADIRENADDSVFAFQAAARLLGEDPGGEGKTGRARRAAARRWQSGAAADPEAGAFPALVLAGLEAREGRYRKADSLLPDALARDPTNAYVPGTLAGLKGELGKVEEQIPLLQTLLRRTGSADVQVCLVRALHQAGRGAEAEEAERRFFLLSPVGDSTRILMARLQAHMAAERVEAAQQSLEARRGRVEESTFDLFASEVRLLARQWDEARRILERLRKESPLDAQRCNNLAWTYALLGVELERAEELAASAVILSADAAASRNTRGAIHARKGEWDRARRAFQEALESDDRPDHAAANEFFLGLCDYESGPKEAALARWRAVQDMEGGGEALAWIRDALARHERGEPVFEAVFSSPVSRRR